MKPIRCFLIMNGQQNGYIFAPIACASISEAVRMAKNFKFPYRIFSYDGVLKKKGWFA